MAPTVVYRDFVASPGYSRGARSGIWMRAMALIMK